ncbi:unnamed protein product [Rotaria sordida]|uniref:Tim44-like domain-containing protein n=1 Tax=Rotaria sordida TaxID=392033 RepID=A0A814LHD8_9BILA|nr:unnamed protein product [Rotaria sordida]CAF0889288.1 unnamed protein product [Rotaria sordida]CAF0990256.1 unnamed protein product [Rotaria sordida]CAF1064269.1 unnamed protein product [Rotaria sordida]CAF3935405.1 unnamed protein product [Rotaria sordida]
MAFIISRSSRSLLTSVLNYSPKLLSLNHLRYTSTNPRPLMLMDLPRIVYPNLFYTIRNFFSRMIISGYFDSTFAIKPFSDGARQALTVVSHLIGNNQFDDLSGLVTQQVIDEVKKNYENLTSEQKQKIPIEESEIVFSYPYLIGMIMDEQINSRLVEITMIFHVLKDRNSYQQEVLHAKGDSVANWAATMKKMRNNIVVCNYKFLRDMSKNANDDTWIISGLNHWLPSEYEQQQ